MPIEIRVCNIDKFEFVEFLRKQIKIKGITLKNISEILDIPLTTVEHYFRTDKCHSFPGSDIWYDLKELLDIETDKYDKELTTYIDGDCKYDIANRVYDSNGIAPTITSAKADIIIVTKTNKGGNKK